MTDNPTDGHRPLTDRRASGPFGYRRRTVLRRAAFGIGAPIVPTRSLQSDGSFVNVLSVDPSAYPSVVLNVRVDTEAGRDGALTREDFTVSERGRSVPIRAFDFSGSAADVVFVFDDTGSMGSEIDAMKDGATDLTASIEDAGIDARYGLVTFKDEVEVDQRLTGDRDAVASAIQDLDETGGGDAPEDNFDAIATALDLSYRRDARKFVVDITDSTSHYPGDGSDVSDRGLAEVADAIEASGVSFVAVAPPVRDEQRSKRTLAERVGGLWMDIGDADFGRILQRVIEVIVTGYEITYRTAVPPGETGDVTVVVDDPDAGTGRDTNEISVPPDAGPADPGSPLDDLPGEKRDVAATVQEQSVLSNVESELGVDLRGDPELAADLIEQVRTAVEDGTLDAATGRDVLRRSVLAEDASARILARIGPGETADRTPSATTNLAETTARYLFDIGVTLLVGAVAVKAVVALGALGGLSIGTATASGKAVVAALSSAVSNLLDYFVTGDTTAVREEMDRGVERLFRDLRDGELPSAADFRAAVNDLVDDLVDTFRDVIRVAVEFGSQASVPDTRPGTESLEPLLSPGPSIYRSITGLHESFGPDAMGDGLPGETDVAEASVERFLDRTTRTVERFEQSTERLTATFGELDSVDAALDASHAAVSGTGDGHASLAVLIELGQTLAAMLADMKEIAVGIGTATGGAVNGFLALVEIRRAHEAIYAAIESGTEVDHEYL